MGRIGSPVILGMLLLSGCSSNALIYYGPLFYRAPEIRGTVIDSTTKEPVADAAVAAIWTLQWLESATVWLFVVQETTTDARGEFHLSAWGPKLRWPLWTGLAYTQPHISLFKDGYGPLTRSNHKIRPDTSVRDSEWNGEQLSLKRPTGDSKSYGDWVNDFAGDLTSEFRRSRTCAWDALPNFLRRLDAAALRLRDEGAWPPPYLPLERWNGLARAAGCSPAKEPQAR